MFRLEATSPPRAFIGRLKKGSQQPPRSEPDRLDAGELRGYRQVAMVESISRTQCSARTWRVDCSRPGKRSGRVTVSSLTRGESDGLVGVKASHGLAAR